MHLTNRRLSLHCVVSLTTVLFFSSRYLLPLWFCLTRLLKLINLHSLTEIFFDRKIESHAQGSIFLCWIYHLLFPGGLVVIQYQSHSLKEVVISWNKPIGRTVLIHSFSEAATKWWLPSSPKTRFFPSFCSCHLSIVGLESSALLRFYL